MLSYTLIKKEHALQKHILFITTLIGILPTITKAYDYDNSSFNYNVSGYVKYESYFDSRQVFGISHDQFLLFPEKKMPDPNGKDINERGQSQMVAIESRLRTTVSGIKVNKVEATGVIEADFFGRITGSNELKTDSNFEIHNIFRLRHAYVQLDWKKLTLQFGQTWHPIAVLECYADTISFNNGAPIEIYSRAPLVKAIYRCSHIKLIGAAATQLEFISDGPDGFSAKYMRNAIIPNLHAQIQGKFGEHVAGTGIDYKRLRPRIVTNKGFKTDESISSIAAIWYLALNFPSVVFRTKIMFGQDAHDYGMISGYAVHTMDPVTDKRTYTNLCAVSAWIDLAIVKSKKIEPGLFVGYAKNIGASKNIILDKVDNDNKVTEKRIFGFATDVDHVFRISPRCRWRINKLTLAGEIEYTRAAFGTINTKGKVKNTCPVGNTRLLLAAYYYF